MFDDVIQLNYMIKYDPLSDDIKEDDLFREDLLAIFRMKKYNDEEIINKINTLFEQVKVHPRYTIELGELFTQRANLIFSEDEQTGFIMMFNFHSMNKMMQLLNKMENETDLEWDQVDMKTIMS